LLKQSRRSSFLLRNPKAHYHAHKNLLVDFILNKMNQLQSLLPLSLIYILTLFLDLHVDLEHGRREIHASSYCRQKARYGWDITDGQTHGFGTEIMYNLSMASNSFKKAQ